MIADIQTGELGQVELRELQLRRLKEQVRRVYSSVPFYREAFSKRGMAPEDIKSLDDLCRLPFTSKLDFRDNYPYGLLAVPLTEVVRLHASSGKKNCREDEH